MHRLRSAPVRRTVEVALVLLVALGALLAGLEPIVVIALTVVACVLFAVLEWVYAREAARAAVPEEAAPPAVEAPSGDETPEAPGELEPEPEPQSRPEPELAVSERSARAILATGSPPVAEPPPREPEWEPEPEPDQPEPEPEPDQPEPERATAPGPEAARAPSREWNVWELERLVREHPDETRREEWAAMILSLRDFARADGSLPPEFDALVRESFGALLATGAATAR